MKKQTDLNLTEGPIFKKLLLFTWPILLRSLIANLYGTADAVMLGQFVGANAMAAVSVAGLPLQWIEGPLINIATGTTVICAMHFGSGAQEKLRESSQTAVLFGLFSGLFMFLLGCLLIKPIIILTNVPSEISTDAALYLFMRLLGTPFSSCSNHCSSILLARGNTRLPMVLGLISGLLNVILNTLFLIVFHLGIVGVALATLCSQMLDFAVYLFTLFSAKSTYGLKLRELKIHWNHLKQILSIGIPGALNGVVFTFSNLTLQASLNTFGALAMAGRSAAVTICNYVTLVQNSFGSAVLSATGQCYGCGKYKRITQIAKIACFGSAGIIAAMAFIFTIFSRFLLSLINADPTVIIQGIPYLLFYSWGLVIYTFTISLSSSLKGIKKATQATLASSVSVIVPRLLWIWVAMPHLKTLNWLYAIYPISWVISGITTVCVYAHYRKRLPKEDFPPETENR